MIGTQSGDLILKDETYSIVGAAMEVSNELGCGFLQAVYQEALGIELSRQNIPHLQQAPLSITYKEHRLMKGYIADFICFGQIIVEVKALKSLSSLEEAQILNYLKAADLPLGLLINFGAPRLEWKRFARTRSNPQANTSERARGGPRR
jgi:GxxExxY protein